MKFLGDSLVILMSWQKFVVELGTNLHPHYIESYAGLNKIHLPTLYWKKSLNAWHLIPKTSFLFSFNTWVRTIFPDEKEILK